MTALARSYDYIIVGGGTAGCVLASRLSDVATNRVLLIEAGPSDSSRLFPIPGAAFMVFANPKNSWPFFTEPQRELNNRALPFTQARVLGGGSTINGMVTTRGAASLYDTWRDMGADGWGYDDLLPYFKRLESSDRGAGPYHGADGPWRIVRAGSDLPIVERILSAFEEVGMKRIDDLNVPAPEGMGFYDWSVRDGRRASMPVTFPGFRGDRSNLMVVTGALVTKVVVEGDRAVGVELVGDGTKTVVRADREVAVCGGAISSPKLLLLSGIGPADELRALGIPVVLDSPQVGRNLQNHTAYRLEYLCSEPITARHYIHPLNGPKELLRYIFTRQGFLAGGASPIGGFYRSSPAASIPDTQVFAIPAFFERKPGLGMLPKIHGYGFGLNQGTPYSRGTVTLRSSDPQENPVIDPHYFEDRRDLEITMEAAMRLREVAHAPSLAKITTKEVTPGPEVRTRAEWEAHVRATTYHHFHVCGTCRMGRLITDSVTDPKLRVHGLKGLRVVDGGVMPLLMNANTNAAVMVVAERAAEEMLAG